MHVIIVGAGEVGGYLAKRLRDEGQDVVVIEQDTARAEALSNELDIQVITGGGSEPAVLDEAGVDRASLVAAVTQNDEVNLIVSLLAKGRGAATTVVRVENNALKGERAKKLFESVGADVVIDPDAETADEILALVHAIGADEVYHMADGELVVIGATLSESSPLTYQNLSSIGAKYTDFLCGSVTRDSLTIVPNGDQQLLPGDHVRILSRSSNQQKMLRLLGVSRQRARKVMVLGGGAIGAQLAQRLEADGVGVTLLERDPKRVNALAARFRHVTVLQGDVTDTELLQREGVGEMDALIAATGEDAANVLASAFAITEGDLFTVAVLHRLALLPLVRRLGIDAALSPRTASANAVLREVRGGATAVATFLESNAEVDEIEIAAGSQADGKKVADLDLPDDILLGAVIRPGHPATIARGDTKLHALDHVVVFGDPGAMSAVRAKFGV